jgi:hypothetical protein
LLEASLMQLKLNILPRTKYLKKIKLNFFATDKSCVLVELFQLAKTKENGTIEV